MSKWLVILTARTQGGPFPCPACCARSEGSNPFQARGPNTGLEPGPPAHAHLHVLAGQHAPLPAADGPSPASGPRVGLLPFATVASLQTAAEVTFTEQQSASRPSSAQHSLSRASQGTVWSPRRPCPLSCLAQPPCTQEELTCPCTPSLASGGSLPPSGPRSWGLSSASPLQLCASAQHVGVQAKALGAGDTVQSRVRVVLTSVCQLGSDRTPPRSACTGTALCEGQLGVTGGAEAPGEKQQLLASAFFPLVAPTSLALGLPHPGQH